METIDATVGNGAMMCGRMTFQGSTLTVSVNGPAQSGLLETVMMFVEYFNKEFPGKSRERLDLFLSERDMHSGAAPFHKTFFDKE